jgi:hypothetical protein
MSMQNFGLLLTMTEPPAALEQEFNVWYDSEHILERLAIPGFLSARRWAADVQPGEGKYLATYELVSPAVLETSEYLRHVGEGLTPWSKRMLGSCTVFRRWACEQIYPGEAQPSPMSHSMFVAIGDVPHEWEDEFNRWYDEEHIRLLAQIPGVLRARRFRDPHGKPRYIALYELRDGSVTDDPAWKAASATEWARRIDQLSQGCEWILRLYHSYTPGHRT